MSILNHVPALGDIQTAHDLIAPYVHRTPVLTSSSIDALAGCSIYFKCENFQKIGAFKMRGAAHAMALLDAAARGRGLATHSSGNHAQAVARAAQLAGVPAYIVMPRNAPAIKRAATAGYGATIIESGNTIAERESKLEEVVAAYGATFIHPYNDYAVIAGQATASKELHEEVPDLEIVVAPVGGGGLLSGTALYTHYARPSVAVIGAEPARVDDAFRAFKSGRIEQNERIDTIADGLRTTLGTRTLPLIRAHVREIMTVEESEIVAAMRLIWERMKIIVEPSCAVPLAAILRHRDAFEGRKVGVILTGGNVDLGALPFAM